MYLRGGDSGEDEDSMQVERTNPEGLTESRLPDGSRLIGDTKNEIVFALNATSGAAWDGCASSATTTASTPAAAAGRKVTANHLRGRGFFHKMAGE